MNPPIPHPKLFGPKILTENSYLITDNQGKNPPGKHIPEGKVGIKKELPVLDWLLFLIFSGNFGFRFSSLLVLQKTKGIIPEIFGFSGKPGEQRAPKSSGIGIFLGIIGRKDLGMSDEKP